MPWWVFLLIAVLGYIAGFLVVGAILSHLMKPTVPRVDLVWAMIFWPVFGPCYGIYRAALAYVESLEQTLAKRRSTYIPPLKNVTKLPTSRQVTTQTGWERNE